MRQEFARFDPLRELEAKIRQEWAVAPSSQVMISTSVELALQEISRGFFSRYPHRLAIGVQDDIRPELETVIPALSREGVKIHRFQKDSSLDQLIQSLGRLGLLTLTATHDPVTGLLSPFEDLIHRCASSRLPVACVTDHPSRVPKNLHAICCVVVPLSPDCVVTLIGERANFEYFSSPLRRFVSHSSIRLSPETESPESVKSFEGSLSEGLIAPLRDREDRIWDRAVILTEQMDGSAWVEECSERVGLNLFSEGAVVTSRCYWGDDLNLEWLKRGGWRDDQIQSLVAIPIRLLAMITPAIQSSVTRHIQQLQKGFT